MIDLVMAALVFGCGVWIGVIASAFVIDRKADNNEFDGGYMVENDVPRVKTRIWSNDIHNIGD